MGNTGIQLENLGVMVGEGTAGRWLFRGLNLSLRSGQCTGVIGRNGVGKTTLLRLCLGQLQADEGTVTIGKKVVFNYIDQERIQLDGRGNLMAEVEDTDGIVFFGDQKLSVRSYLRRFLFSDSRVNERVDRLSGGERARLLLAKVLKRGGNLVVLDEPTNDLDLASLRMLEEALASFDGSVLVVSHDRFFLDRICDQIVAFEENSVFIQPGNYSYYLEKKKERLERASRTVESVAQPVGRTTDAITARTVRQRKLTFKEQRELQSMEETILAAEARVHEFEAALNDAEFYVTRAAEAPNLITALETARGEVSRLYARWQELERIAR
jgi:ATP-binding cassette subfamily F protein uup